MIIGFAQVTATASTVNLQRHVAKVLESCAPQWLSQPTSLCHHLRPQVCYVVQVTASADSRQHYMADARATERRRSTPEVSSCGKCLTVHAGDGWRG